MRLLGGIDHGNEMGAVMVRRRDEKHHRSAGDSGTDE